MSCQYFNKPVIIMGLIIDVNSEIGAHDWRDLGYLICLRYLFISRAVKNLTYFPLYERNMFELPYDKSTKVIMNYSFLLRLVKILFIYSLIMNLFGQKFG